MTVGAQVLDPTVPQRRECIPHGLRGLLGECAWQRLPLTVRDRFADPLRTAVYSGVFEEVTANHFGRSLAWICRLIGTPVAPWTGRHVAAVVHVGPHGRGVQWRREYHWENHPASVVCSTKVVTSEGELVEELAAGLCMALEVYEKAGALIFLSRNYYFHLGPIFANVLSVKVRLPRWLSPGTTRVEHRDEEQGWFRFTMTVSHPLFGKVFYQTGRFRARGG